MILFKLVLFSPCSRWFDGLCSRSIIRTLIWVKRERKIYLFWLAFKENDVENFSHFLSRFRGFKVTQKVLILVFAVKKRRMWCWYRKCKNYVVFHLLAFCAKVLQVFQNCIFKNSGKVNAFCYPRLIFFGIICTI